MTTGILPVAGWRDIHLRWSRAWSNVLPCLWALGAVSLWSASLAHMHIGDVSDLGVVSIMPATMVVAMILLLIGFCLVLRENPVPEPILVLYVLALIIMLYGLTAFIEPQPRFSDAWGHIGFVDYILRTGQSDGKLDIYFSWPGFFVLGAFFTRAFGLSSLLGLSAWSPVFFNLLYLSPLLMLFNALTTDKRRIWLSVWCFYLCNWLGQDYFAPQALGLFVYLSILAVLTRFFSRDNVVAGRGPSDARTAGKVQRVALIGLVMALVVVAVVSHQLTPFAILLSGSALVLMRLCAARTVPLFVFVATLAWYSYAAVSYTSGHMADLTDGLGGVSSVVGVNVTSRLRGSEEHLLIVHVRLLMAGVVWVLAALGAIRLRMRGRLDVSACVVVAAPFALLPLQAYGGEMLLRVYLFGLPGAVVLLAAWFFAEPASTISGAKLVAIGATTAVLLGGFVFARYGNERMDYMTKRDVAAVQFVYKIARPRSMLVALTPHLPWKYKDFEKYHYETVFASLDTEQQTAILTGRNVDAVVRIMSEMPRHRSYLIVTRTQKVEANLFLGLPRNQVARFEQALLHSGRFRVIFDDGDAQVFVLSDRGGGLGASA